MDCCALQMKKIEDARKIYERLVTQFPNAGRYWKIYIEHEVNINILYSSKCHKDVCFLCALFYLHASRNRLASLWYKAVKVYNGINFDNNTSTSFYRIVTIVLLYPKMPLCTLMRVYIKEVKHRE